MAVAPHEVHKELPSRLARLARALEDRFLGKDEIIRLLLVATIAGEHAVLVGPPGTAKSALIRTFARLMQARYFEYLLTRFTEPNEIFGPVDIAAFREGRYERRTDGMLPDAEIVFLDEVFKSNSAILNALLTLLNERRYTSGGRVIRCPLLSAFGASNEVPTDETLTAIYDRFILRIRSDNLDAYHFQDLLQKGIDHEMLELDAAPGAPLVDARELAELQRGLLARTHVQRGVLLPVQGARLPDPRRGSDAQRPARREAPEALRGQRLPRRPRAAGRERSRSCSSTSGTTRTRRRSSRPSSRRCSRRTSASTRGRVASAPSVVGIEALAGEIERVRQVLTGAASLGDVQLFSQLKALGEIKTALASSADPARPRARSAASTSSSKPPSGAAASARSSPAPSSPPSPRETESRQAAKPPGEGEGGTGRVEGRKVFSWRRAARSRASDVSRPTRSRGARERQNTFRPSDLPVTPSLSLSAWRLCGSAALLLSDGC